MLNYLTETFGYNKPFRISEIKYKNCSRAWKYTCITELCEKGEVARFEKGIYYIPEKTKFGVKPFDPMTVIEKKYMNDGENHFGYFSGAYMMYKLGLSSLNPKTIDVYTNNETKDSKIVFVGGKRLRLHSTRTIVDKWNFAVQCFLELMNGIDIEDLDEYKKKLLADYIDEHHITKCKITEHIKYFPNKTCRNLIESEVIYSVKL